MIFQIEWEGKKQPRTEDPPQAVNAYSSGGVLNCRQHHLLQHLYNFLLCEVRASSIARLRHTLQHQQDQQKALTPHQCIFWGRLIFAVRRRLQER